MKEGAEQDMQYFDSEIAELVRAGIVDESEAMTHATNPQQLRDLLKPEC